MFFLHSTCLVLLSLILITAINFVFIISNPLHASNAKNIFKYQNCISNPSIAGFEYLPHLRVNNDLRLNPKQH